MAEALVTQVDRTDTSTAAAKPAESVERRGWFSALLCCCSPSRAGNQRAVPATAQWPSMDPGHNLLPRIVRKDTGKKCLVLDLDETLVHSSFKPVPNPDFVVPIEIDGTVHNVFVLKRPFVDEFLAAVGDIYEVVLFTASLSKYADPVSDHLDKGRVFRHRLFREHCVYHRGNYVKDLARLGRDVSTCIILDNSPASYMFHPENAVPILSWFDDASDTVLRDLIPFLRELAVATDIYPLLR